jgi:aldose 1-epimerase
VKAGVEVRGFGQLPDGREVHQYRLDNGRGLVLTALDYGGIVTGLWVPDACGHSVNVMLGFDTLADYVERNPYFGVIAGRYANRIRHGRFTLDGETYQLDRNQGGHCLHGGRAGFGSRLWKAVSHGVDAEGCAALRLDYTSADGEMGFPGELAVQVRYTLGPDMGWRIDYEARCDRPTVLNLCSHAYFNLAGEGGILDHELSLAASRYTEADPTGIPLQHRSVEGTPFDFRRPRRIAEARFDHNWLLDHPFDGGLHPAARLVDPGSGRTMTVSTSEPALQFYSGQYLNGSLRGPAGRVYGPGAGLCLETQHNPDSPNHAVAPDWPGTVLRPGEVFRSATLHAFG